MKIKTFKKNKLNLPIIPLSLVNNIKHLIVFSLSWFIFLHKLYKIRTHTHIENHKDHFTFYFIYKTLNCKYFLMA